MQDIANGTFNYATLNEIMPMIYKRFTEKSSDAWRQIYKVFRILDFCFWSDNLGSATTRIPY